MARLSPSPCRSAGGGPAGGRGGASGGRWLLVAGAALAAGCPAESGSRADAALEDARPADADPLAPDAPPPYRHTILIDGVDDFTPDESFPTTTASYGAYLTWDGEQLFVGCSGPDAAVTAPDAASKWFFVYLDTDPGTGLGAYLGEQYNTQQPGFPTGFAAEFYLRWKGDDTLIELESFAGAGQWNVEPVSIERAALGTFREAAIPLAALDHPGVIGVTTLMMNEKPFGEWSYAGLFTASFTDGYYDAAVGPVPASRYLEILLASSRLPGDPAAERP